MTQRKFKVIDGQPDDPGTGVCPHCGCRCHRDPDEVARKLLERSAGRVDKKIIARALCVSVDWLERFAGRCKPPFDLTTPREREDEPRGA